MSSRLFSNSYMNLPTFFHSVKTRIYIEQDSLCSAYHSAEDTNDVGHYFGHDRFWEVIPGAILPCSFADASRERCLRSVCARRSQCNCCARPRGCPSPPCSELLRSRQRFGEFHRRS